MTVYNKPVVCGIFPRRSSCDYISLENPTGRSRSRSPLNRSPRNSERFYTPPTSPSALYSHSPFKTPPNSPQHHSSSPMHGWDDSSKREVDLKCDSDFNNPNGAMSSLIVSGNSRPRDVFVFPSKQLPASERDMHVVKFTAKLNNIKSPNKVEKAKAILSRVATVPQCETEKIKIVDHQWAKNLGTVVDNLPSSSLDRGFEKTVELTDSQSGPRVAKLSTIYDTHTAEDSLRIERYLKLCKLLLL